MQVPALNSFFSTPSFSRPFSLGDASERFVSASQSFFQSSARLSLSGAETSEGRFDGFRVFDQLLQKGYAQLQSRSGAGPRPAANEPLTAARAANNVLGFIERRLQQDIKEGAGGEQLASRLEAGLEGFKKGFAEARGELESIGLLSESVEGEIGETYDRVLAGIDGLREKYLNQGGEKTGSASIANDEPEAAPVVSTQVQAAAEYRYARRNTFSFELRTADGDTVKIRASAQEAFALAAEHSYSRDGGRISLSQSFAAHYSSASRFSLSVEGELDEGELAAINDLLGQVNDLSERFFAGDLESAFNDALNLGYNSDEITRFALNLSRTEVARAASAYQRNDVSGRPAAPAPADRLVPLGHFARGLLEAVDTAGPFGRPYELIRDLADQLAGLHGREQRFPDKHFGPFVSRLLG